MGEGTVPGQTRGHGRQATDGIGKETAPPPPDIRHKKPHFRSNCTRSVAFDCRSVRDLSTGFELNTRRTLAQYRASHSTIP
eukprot:3941162-Rhodomonas_salina.1